MTEKIAVVRIEFHHLPDYILTKEEYEEFGGWIGLLKGNHFQMKDVKKVHHELMDVRDFPKEEWEG